MGIQVRSRPRSRRPIDVLFTKTQQQVLTLLFCHPDRSYAATELIAFARSGSGSTQRLLADLEHSGLVTTSKLGKRRLYRANTNTGLFRPLHDLLIQTVGLVDPLRTAIDALGTKVRLALVYGSIAKGTEHAESDVDLLIVADDLTLEDTFATFERAERTIGRRVHPTLYTPREFQKRLEDKHPFLTNVLAGDHIVLVGSIDADPATR
jgi:predicted nucleotidyltransferase